MWRDYKVVTGSGWAPPQENAMLIGGIGLMGFVLTLLMAHAVSPFYSGNAVVN